jgi:hypothetical protein
MSGVREMTREEFIQEIKLRKLIRRAIRISEAKKTNKQKTKSLHEEKLRHVIRKLLLEKDVDSDSKPAPASSTTESILKDAFNKILPVIEDGLRSLSEADERRSYRVHMLEKFKNIFKNIESMQIPDSIGEGELEEAEGDVEVNIVDDDPEAPSRVVPDIEKKRFEEPKRSKEETAEDEFEKFRVPDLDPTGARIAYEAIENSNIKNVIESSLATLYKPEYKKQFKDYTMYNVDLWLVTYEQELAKEQGQEPAFTETIISEPEGAKPAGERAAELMGGDLGLETDTLEEPEEATPEITL